jgi:nucleoside phosphorylase
MILIVGSSNDDILYFESILKNKKEISVLNQFTAYSGEIFNQKVMLLKDIYSSYLSAAVISHVIEKFMVILVIYVGEVQSFTDSLNVGDICICRQSVIADINLSDVTNVAKGQIPGFQQSFLSNAEITEAINTSLENRTSAPHRLCTFISTNYHPEDKEKMDAVAKNDMILGIAGEVVLSSEIGGIAIASKLHDVPYSAVCVVGRKIGFKSGIQEYLSVLEQYTNIGKAVISLIGDIGRTDVVKQ